ncbi:oxidoreductase [Endozoicomonadaceae bacterium StTr2]
MPTQPIKTAVVGYGYSARTFHIPFLSQLSQFKFSAISSSQADAVRQAWPNIDHYSSAKALLTESDAELVIITAPNDVHFELAALALEQGKHVILEKPFVTRVADGDRLIELARAKQRVLSVYHNRRWDGDFMTVKKLLESQQLGDIKLFESRFDRFRPEVRQRWREQATDGGGILFDLGPHLIDQALDLFGLPEALTAQSQMLRDKAETVDYFNIILHYPDKQVVLHSDLFSAGPNKRFSVRGTLGSFEKYGLDPQEDQLKAGIEPTTPVWGQEAKAQYGTLYTAEAQQSVKTEAGCYQHYFNAIAAAIRNDAEVPVTAEDALWNIRLIELAMQSSEQGRTLAVSHDAVESGR